MGIVPADGQRRDARPVNAQFRINQRQRTGQRNRPTPTGTAEADRIRRIAQGIRVRNRLPQRPRTGVVRIRHRKCPGRSRDRRAEQSDRCEQTTQQRTANRHDSSVSSANRIQCPAGHSCVRDPDHMDRPIDDAYHRLRLSQSGCTMQNAFGCARDTTRQTRPIHGFRANRSFRQRPGMGPASARDLREL